MKATFNDFLKENPNCSKFANNSDAIAIFNILSKEKNIIAMIDASDAGKPALSACVNEVESFFENSNNPTIDLRDGFTRTVIGRMVKSILAPFGYEPSIQKDLPKAISAKYFTSASCYEKTGTASMRIVRTIEEI
ncbi:MAG: hypothetical protein H5T98_04330 [Syntrophomonadaceae bacterium]|nr:hypothetical protein [Syntrophomonadaceae bacterium]